MPDCPNCGREMQRHCLRTCRWVKCLPCRIELRLSDGAWVRY